jgi:hypothetical protein
MSPILSLVLAATLSQAEPTREHVRLIAAAVELHAAIEHARTAPACADAADVAFRYCPQARVRLDGAAPLRSDARASIVYSLATPVFRDLL